MATHGDSERSISKRCCLSLPNLTNGVVDEFERRLVPEFQPHVEVDPSTHSTWYCSLIVAASGNDTWCYA